MNRRLLILVLLGLGACDGCHCGGPEVPPPEVAPLQPAVVVPVEPSLPEDPPSLLLTGIEGSVETLSGGEWRPARQGQALLAQDAVRTGADARATVALDEATEVTLWEGSWISIDEIRADAGRLRLEQGRLGADLRGDKALEVEAAGSTAVARADSGRFSVFNNGAGLVAVASETAEVQLTTEGGDQVLAAGELGTLTGDDPTPKVQAIPESVFLSVAWPDGNRTRAVEMDLSGRVDPGSQVAINGTLARVDDRGRFRAQVPLAKGRNEVSVDAVDILGRRATKAFVIQVIRDGPEVRVESEALWK